MRSRFFSALKDLNKGDIALFGGAVAAGGVCQHLDNKRNTPEARAARKAAYQARMTQIREQRQQRQERLQHRLELFRKYGEDSKEYQDQFDKDRIADGYQPKSSNKM